MTVSNFWSRVTLLFCLFMSIRWISYQLKTIDGELYYLTPWQITVAAGWDFLLLLSMGIAGAALVLIIFSPVLVLRLRQREAMFLVVLKFINVIVGLLIGITVAPLFLQWLQITGLSAPTLLKWFVNSVTCLIALNLLLARPLGGAEPRDRQPNPVRRSLLALGAASASVIALDAVTGQRKAESFSIATPPAGALNILLVTFDALSARDMSLYGYTRPTTPYMEKFAKNATVFDNFYSCSTFTTPSMASIMTGRYPSEIGVYHLQGVLREEDRRRTLFSALRQGGYTIAASIGNPWAQPLRLGVDEPSLLTKPPTWRLVPITNRLTVTGQPVLFATALAQEGHLWELHERLAPADSQFPPRLGFSQAEELLAHIPPSRPYFLWVHLFAPHAPYKPQPDYQRALGKTPATSEPRSRYDAFIAECDAELKRFMGRLESRGHLRNTAVIFSADHGESFEGGVMGHGMSQQVTQQIHIPLVIKRPGQTFGRRVTAVADQTSLAPTILELAGLAAPAWMRGRSLTHVEQTCQGLAFTQYLSGNSVFGPLHTGTVGIIDGQTQYVVDIKTGRGVLHSLQDAWRPDIDNSAAEPQNASRLREAIHERFPSLLNMT